MASNLNEILGRNIDSVKSLKQAIKELQDSLVGLDTESQEYKDTATKLTAAQDALKDTTRAGVEANLAAKDSIVGLQKEYNKLYDSYKKLSDEERNSDFGKNMAASLENLSSTINNSKKEVGNFTSNIGRYAEGATEAFNKMGISLGSLQAPMKMAAGGAKTFGAALKGLAANPIVLVITALVAILVKAAEAIKKNEELTNRLKEAMSVFRPVLDAVANVFDFLAGLLVKTVEGLSKVAEKVLSIIPGMKKAIQSHKELAKATNDLTKAQREANVENSKKQAEIERLREEASATDDVVEKKRLLEEAKAMQAEIDQKNIELAQEELRIMQEYGEKTANSAEENEKLAAAQKKVNDAIAQGERNQRMYNKQLDATTSKTKAAASSGKNYREEAKKLYDQLVEESKTEITKLTEKYEKEKKLLEKYHLDTTLLTKKYNKEITAIETDRTRKQIAMGEERYQEAVKSLRLNEQLWTEEERIMSRINEIRSLKPNNTIFDQKYNELAAKYATQNKLLFKAIEEATNHDLTNITDYNSIIEQLNYNIELFKEKQPEASETWKQVLETVKKLGEPGWINLTKPLQEAANKLKTDFEGLDLSNMLNLSSTVENFKKNELPKLYDMLADIRIDSATRNSKIDLFKDIFSFDTGQTSFQEMTNYMLEGEWTLLEQQKTLYENELANFKGTQDKKLELLQAYYGVVEKMYNRQNQLEQLHAERTQEIWDAAYDHFDAWTSSLDSVLGTIGAVMQAEIDSGKLTEKEAKKKEKALKRLEAIQLAVAIANIAANTAAGIMDVWRGYAAELPLNAETAAATGPAAAATKAALDAKSLAAAIIKTSAIGVQGTAQIAAAVGGYISKSKAASMDSEGGSAGVGIGATPTLIDSTPYSYTKTVQTTEEEDKLNQPIWVSVVDVENALGQQAKVKTESSF